MSTTFHNIRNADELDQFHPVSGEYYTDGSNEDRSRADIEESVRNHMDAEYKIEVKIYHLDGREIMDDIPASGCFIATRQ